MGRTGLIIAALLMAAPVSAAAAPKGTDALLYSAKYYRCMEGRSDQTPVDCLLVEFDTQDKRLNRAYQADLASLAKNPTAKAALIKAQRAWLAFREADSASVKALSGSTAPSYDAMLLELEYTARRANALENLLQP